MNQAWAIFSFLLSPSDAPCGCEWVHDRWMGLSGLLSHELGLRPSTKFSKKEITSEACILAFPEPKDTETKPLSVLCRLSPPPAALRDQRDQSSHLPQTLLPDKCVLISCQALEISCWPWVLFYHTADPLLRVKFIFAEEVWVIPHSFIFPLTL